MKAKFALIRHTGDEKLNSIFVKKISNCKDVVILDYTKVNFKKYGESDSSIAHRNWSKFKEHELFNLDGAIKIAFQALIPKMRFNENLAITTTQEEIFMFTSDANSTYINLMKDNNTKVFPFELNKKKAKSIIDSTELMKAYQGLTFPYLENQQLREKITSQIEFTQDAKYFVENEVKNIENSIIKGYEDIFSFSINEMKNILLSGWK